MNTCFIGEKNSFLAKLLSTELGVDLYSFEQGSFPSSESIIHFPKKLDLVDHSIFVVYQFKGQCDTFSSSINHQLANLFFLIRYLKKFSPQNIFLIAPYIPYSRQEKKNDDDVASLFDVFENILMDLGVKKVITCELHKPKQNSSFFQHFSLSDFWEDQLLKFISSVEKENICIVSPDHGGINRSQSFAKKIGSELAFFEKQRTGVNEITMTNFVGNVRGKTAILIDDIIDSAQTAVHACEILHLQGAESVIGCFAHGIFSNGSFDRIKNSFFDKLFVTNTILYEPQAMPSIITTILIEKFLVDLIKKNIDLSSYGVNECTPHSINLR